MSDDYKQVLLLGDIHGQFHVIKSFVHRIELRDSLIIQVGDFGIGFCPPQEVVETHSLNKCLHKFNNKLMVVRGNHCNPSFYKGKKRIDFNNLYSNIKLIEDGSTQNILGKKVLFIGGAISIDRLDRTEGVDYWTEECVDTNLNSIESCDVIISHSCSKHFDVGGNINWYLRHDKALQQDLDKEREILHEVAKIAKPKEWYFGHFHQNKKGVYKNTKESLLINWQCVDINQFVEF